MRKKEILKTIYQIYDSWMDKIKRSCEPGCCTCCTQNVNITALEGEIIYDFIKNEKKEQWLAAKLSRNAFHGKAGPSTNQYATACLQGEELHMEEASVPDLSPCPFLNENLCEIYAVRPFACRCFISTEKCDRNGEGVLPGVIISGATATQQIIEHLGQREWWGNMLDVLLALAEQPDNQEVARKLENRRNTAYGQARLISAQPLPGFLIPPEDEEEVGRLLRQVFTREVQGVTIEDYLNGKK